MAEAAEVAIQQQEAQNTESVDQQKDTIPPEADSDAQNTETGEQPEQPAESTEQQEAKRLSKFQRRLERQKTARIQAETRAQIAEERLARLEEQSRQQQSRKEEAPKREDFDDYESYLDARQDWRSEQRRAESSQPQQEPPKRPQADPQAAIAADWTKREDAFKATARDYETVVEPFVSEDIGALSDQARRVIIDSENGPRLLYHLAKNDADVERIADLSPARQVRR